MREGIIVEVSAADRARLEAMVADRNSPQKHVWRARIVLLTAAGHGTVAIMRQAGVSKVAVYPCALAEPTKDFFLWQVTSYAELSMMS